MWLVRNKVGFSFSKSGQKKVWKNWKVFKRFHGESHSHYSRLIDYIPIEFTCTCQCRCMATNNDDAVDSLCCVIYSSAYAFSFLTSHYQRKYIYMPTFGSVRCTWILSCNSHVESSKWVTVITNFGFLGLSHHQ